MANIHKEANTAIENMIKFLKNHFLQKVSASKR